MGNYSHSFCGELILNARKIHIYFLIIFFALKFSRPRNSISLILRFIIYYMFLKKDSAP